MSRHSAPATPPDRARIRQLVQQTLEPLSYVHAIWEGGSTAFGRDDAWSDVDLQVCVDDDRVTGAFAAVESACAKVCPIESTYPVPEPAWHGHSQRFYRFKYAAPWMMLDLCVLKRSSERRFLEREIHGEQVFLVDKIGLAASRTPLDVDQWDAKLRARVAELRTRTGMFAILVEKEIRRRHPIDALGFYNSLIVAPLVELLRIRHDPWRHNFGMRYLHDALPGPVARRLETLIFVRNAADLSAKYRTAVSWIDAIARELTKAPRLVFAPAPFPRKT